MFLIQCRYNDMRINNKNSLRYKVWAHDVFKLSITVLPESTLKAKARNNLLIFKIYAFQHRDDISLTSTSIAVCTISFQTLSISKFMIELAPLMGPDFEAYPYFMRQLQGTYSRAA